jgi:ubiquinone/menaquinone biosynthesis C-methylase UbiE
MTSIKNRWIDRWLCSDADELLEHEGATPQGIKIIDELNQVYQQTGLTRRLVKTIVGQAKDIHRSTGHPVKILEIGMRDGAFLSEIEKFASSTNIPLELHGVEFRPDITSLAEKRLALNRSCAQVHHDTSHELSAFESQDFDIVFSAFVLHHQSLNSLKRLLMASFRVSRHSVFHLDLERSTWRLILLWVYYSLFGYHASRGDAVLSIRRAFRRKEIAQIIHQMSMTQESQVKSVPPLYWAICKSFGDCKI